MIFKLWFALCLAFGACAGNAAALHKAATSAELAQTQERVQRLEQELAIHKHTLELSLGASDKRLSDFGVLATMLGTQTSWVGNLVAMVSIGITILVFGAGFITYFSSTQKAKNEARDAVRQWFDTEAKDLKAQIQQHQQEAESAQRFIADHMVSFKYKVQGGFKFIDDETQKFKDAKNAADEIMRQAVDANASPDTYQRQPHPQASHLVQEASDNLKAKAEKDFTAKEHYIRGVSLYSSGNFPGALASFEATIKAAVDAAPLDQTEYLFAKGATLGALGKFEEEIAVYNDIDRRFGRDVSPDVRSSVTMANVKKGIALGNMGKFEEAIAVYDDIDRRFGQDVSPGVRDLLAMGLVTKGIVLGTLGRPEEEIALYDDVDRRFGKDESPGVRKPVVMGLVNKGAKLGTVGRGEEAIAVYDDIDRRFGQDESPGVRKYVAMGLIGKGFALFNLGRPEEAIAAYDDVNRRFDQDVSPDVRETVAKAVTASGFVKIMLAKVNWSNETRRQELLSAATSAMESALPVCVENDRAIVLGNLGYALFLAGRHQDARAPTSECLILGGQKLLDAQLADASQHRVLPEDSNYEQLLSELWRSLGSGGKS